MCGIFGWVADGDGRLDVPFLERVAVDTESRGPHAFGFAWIDGRNRLRMFKQSGRISDHLSLLRMARDARMLIGHCRYATHGSPSNNLNNHPHPCDGGWIVHNGVIGDYREINEGHCLHPVSACDSETLALLIEELDGTLIERCSAAVEECATSALAMLGLWRSPMRMVAARAGNPLHWARYEEGFYLASNASALPNCGPADNGTALSFTIRDGRTHVVEYDVSVVAAARV